VGELATALTEPRTQTDLRKWAFAKRLLEVVDVGAAYRDVFHPGKDVTPGYVIAGNNLLKDENVGKVVKHLAEPALLAAGVEREFAIKRLVETVDSDLTDFADDAGSFLDLAAMKANLPPEKRRLVKKYRETIGPKGDVTSRTIELEPKQPAMELLARILNLVQPASVTINNEQNLFVGQSKDDLRAEIVRRMQNLAQQGTLPPALEGVLAKIAPDPPTA
jgi:hypothetical protein